MRLWIAKNKKTVAEVRPLFPQHQAALTTPLGPIGQLIGRGCLDPEIILKLQEDRLIS